MIPAKSQEEHWFARLETERRRRREAAGARAALANELRVREDDAALDALLAHGLHVETLAAAEWIPMILVAWADGAVQPAEREAILRAARADGIPEDDPANALLERWLETPPAPNLIDAWEAFLSAMARADGEDALAAHESWVVERAREIAVVAGGWVGIGRVSRDESAVLDRVTSGLRAARQG